MNRRTMMAAARRSRLPAGFQEVEYIGSDGGQYVNTGVIASPFFSSKFDLNLKNAISGSWNGSLTGYGCAFGARKTTKDSEIQVTSYATNSAWTARFGNGESALSDYRNQRVGVSFNKDGEHIVRINETDYSLPVPFFTQSNNVYLFALNNAGTAAQNSIMDFYGGDISIIKPGGSPSNYTIGSMVAQTGAPQTSTTRILSEYFSVSEGAVLSLSNNLTNMIVHPFDKDTGLSTGASTSWISSYTATKDEVVRILIRKSGNATITSDEIETLASLLQISSNTATGGSETKRNFVPCYRKADGEIGVYDLVSEAFFTNQGTGAFTKGADIN